jgi:hypothetical protein
MTELEMVRMTHTDDYIRDLIEVNLDCARNSRIIGEAERFQVWQWIGQLQSLLKD